MIRRHIGKKPPHERAQAARDPLHQAGPFRQPHHAEPQGHDPDQPERDRDRGLRAVEGAVGHFLEPVVPAADRDREHDECEPDVIQHGSYYNRGARRGERLFAMPDDLVGEQHASQWLGALFPLAKWVARISIPRNPPHYCFAKTKRKPLIFESCPEPKPLLP